VEVDLVLRLAGDVEFDSFGVEVKAIAEKGFEFFAL
jgi:hypothetical protein